MQSSAPIKMLPVIHLYASFTCISKYMKIGIFSVDLFADVRFYFYLLDKQQLNVSSVHLTVTYPICLLKKHGRGLGNKWTQIYASMHKPNRCRYIYIYLNAHITRCIVVSVLKKFSTSGSVRFSNTGKFDYFGIFYNHF